MNQKVVVYEPKRSRLERLKSLCNNAYARTGAVLTVSTMSVMTHADKFVDTTAITAGMDEGTGNSKMAMAGALGILIGFVIWRYTKRGVNSA